MEGLGARIVIAEKAVRGQGRGEDVWRGKRQTIELVFGMLKDWLDLERLKARTRVGLVSRVMQRLLAFTAARYGNFINQEPSWRLAHYGH